MTFVIQPGAIVLPERVIAPLDLKVLFVLNHITLRVAEPEPHGNLLMRKSPLNDLGIPQTQFPGRDGVAFVSAEKSDALEEIMAE